MFSHRRGASKMIRASRMALQLELGRELTSDEEACHSCDNPPCCNPKHLFVGDHNENMKDYAAKGFAKGQKHSRVKLTPDNLILAFKLRDSGKQVKDIADLVGISPSQLSRILRGLTGHTPQENP
jgi:AraC-like DNA-binding protein